MDNLLQYLKFYWSTYKNSTIEQPKRWGEESPFLGHLPPSLKEKSIAVAVYRKANPHGNRYMGLQLQPTPVSAKKSCDKSP